MTSKADPKREVREFYDQVGWQEVSDGLYQNARYEDLRPVSREYIHNCHLRVKKHLHPTGRLLLDAGSGPIQYPEYLTYSEGYEYRVCADISIQALLEARKRIGDHGLMVVSDIANLPFKSEVFDGVVSLHTIHHLPLDEHLQAYQELNRLLLPDRTAVVVNGWHRPPFGEALNRIRVFIDRVRGGITRRVLGREYDDRKINVIGAQQKQGEQKGTFVQKNDAHWVKREIGSQLPIQIFPWRSVSVKVLRSFIHQKWGGRYLLKLLFWFEEKFPHWFGENGQYPIVVIHKLVVNENVTE